MMEVVQQEMKENPEQLHQELEERINNCSMLSPAHRFGPQTL